jgi:NRPS condensation-like uncharacterized protein
MVLPLPLVPFERYMLADDRPAYPMNSFIRLRFSGRFDRTALETAMSVAVSRHPLLAAVACRLGRRWIWQPADYPPTIRWLDALPAESLPRLDPLDVRAMPGLRAAVCEGPGQTDITLQAHHACCDGVGILAFAEDLLGAYATARGTTPAMTLRPLAPEQLQGRGRLGPWRFLRMCPNHLVGLLGARQFLMRRPEPLIPHRAQIDDGAPPDYPASLTRRLEEPQTAEVLASARALGVTLNDLLAREIFLSMARWRQPYVPDRRDKWLRLCVPINLRTTAHNRLPAANVASMVFLDRRPRDLKDAGQLLASIHDEMQLIKRLELGWTFVQSLGVCRRLPGGLERMCRTDRCMSTVVLSNLGTLFACCQQADERGLVRAADVVLREMDLLPPLRPLTCAAFTAWSYAGRLCFTLHYDPRVLTAGQAAELIDGFTESVCRSVITQQQTALEVGA